MADRRVLLGIVLVVLAWACCSMLAFVSSSMPGSLPSTELLSASEAPEASPELRPLGVWSNKGLDPGTAQLLLNQNLLKHVLDVRVQNQNALRHQLKKRVRGLKALKKQPEQAVASETLQAGAAGALASATFATARAVQSMAATMQAELNEMKPHATTSHLARTRRGPKKLRHRTRLDDVEEDGTDEKVDEEEEAQAPNSQDEEGEAEAPHSQDEAEEALPDNETEEAEAPHSQDEVEDANAHNSQDAERPQEEERPQNDEDEEEEAGGLPFGKKNSIVSSPGASIGVTVEGDNNAVSMGGHDAKTFPGEPGGVCGCCGQSGCGCCQGGPAGGGCSCCGHSGCGCCHSGGVSHSRGAVAGSSNDHHTEIQIEERLEKREDAFEEHLENMIEESEKQKEKEEEEHKTDEGLEEEEEHLKEEEKEFEEQKEQEEEEVQKEKDEERLEEKEEHENTKETPGVTPNMHIEVKPIISVNTNGGGQQHILGGCGGGGDCSGCAGNNSGCAEGASHSAANHDFEAMLIEHLDKWMEDHSKSGQDEPPVTPDETTAPVIPNEPVEPVQEPVVEPAPEPVEPVPDYVCDNPDCPEDSQAKCKVYVAGFNEDGELIISKDDEPKEGQNFYVSQCGTCDGSAGLSSRSGNVCKPTEPEEKPVEDEKGGDEPEEKALEMAEESFIPEPCPPGSHRVTDEEECIPEPCPSGSHRVTEGEDCIPVPCPPGSHRVTPGEECEPEPSSPSDKTAPPDYICHNPDCPENQEAKCKVYTAAFNDDGGLVISEEAKLQEGMFYFSSCGTCDDSGHNNRLGNACNPTSEPGVQISEPGVAESEPGVAEPEAEPQNNPTVPADCPDCPEPPEPEAEPENICFHPDCPDKKCRVYKNAAGAFYSECEACGDSVKSSNIEKFKTVEGTIVTFEGNACTHDLTPTPRAIEEEEEEAPPGFQPASAPLEPPPAPYAPPEPCPEGTRGPGDPPCPRAEEVKALEAVLEQKKEEERMENAKKAVLDQEIEFLKGELENDKENLKSDKAELKMETTKLAKYKTDFQQQQEKQEMMHQTKMLAEKQVLKDLQGSFSPVKKILDPMEEEQIKEEEKRQAEENQAFEAKRKEEKQFEVKKEEAEEGLIEAQGKRISHLEGKMQEIELSEQSSTETPVFKPY